MSKVTVHVMLESLILLLLVWSGTSKEVLTAFVMVNFLVLIGIDQLRLRTGARP